ncbi:MAG: ABC transporter substrate-binding protein [Sporichthyaceae bacterium]
MVIGHARWVLVGTCVALAVAGCGGRGETAADGPAPGATPGSTAGSGGALPKFNYTIDNAATGPAPAVPGATAGGTIRVYDEVDYQHLDPARIYTTYENTASLLISRGLTGFRQQGTDVTLVGDLATNTGVTTDGGKTWTFTLRDGVAWEDGAPITAEHVKYGIERSFAKEYNEGPTYLQTWLTDNPDYRKVYDGPYAGRALDAVKAPDAKTVVFSFNKPRPDVPFALSLPASSPVRKDKDTKDLYTKKPFASGPYRIVEHQADKSMSLVRNDAWKPESDPIRTNYPDKFEFVFGERPVDSNRNLIGAAGDYAYGMTVGNLVSQEVLPQVLNSPELVARTVSGLTPGMEYIALNTKRITDVRVRKALLYAYPRAQARQASGGPDIGDFASTLSSPTLIGHESYDLYNAPPEGDPVKAKALLEEAGMVGMNIVHAYRATEQNERRSIVVRQALEKAGFVYVAKPLPPKTGNDEIRNPNNSFDMYYASWFADWPSGSTVFVPLLDGRQIRQGSYNTSFFDDPAINAEMDAIQQLTDPIEAGKRWAALDRRIMEQVPMIPDLYTKTRRLFGPKVGNVTLDAVLGKASLNKVYVKQ